MNDLLAPDPPATVSDERPIPTKRISTPAGDRLQTILEASTGGQRKSFRSSRQSGWGGTTLGYSEPGESGASYTTIWSDAGATLKEADPQSREWKRPAWLSRRGGWKRLSLLAILLILIIVGLVVGLVLGLRKGHDEKSTTSPTSSPAPDSSPEASTPATTRTIGNTVATPTSAATGTSTATPSSFPVGQYSFVTFLDTILTNCTSNPSTWTCPPYTLYSDNPTSSMATFNWNITTGSGTNNYQISSVSNPFATSFNNVDLSLVDAGKASEAYFFQFQFDKEVRPTSSLTSDNTATACFYNSTTFQAYMYTKQGRNYPTSEMSDSSASYDLWPFAVKVEEVVGGGDNVPNCYTAIDNIIGAPINSSSLTPQPAGSLCDCLYLNYLPDATVEQPAFS